MSLDKENFELIDAEYQRLKQEIENELHEKLGQREAKVNYSNDPEERKEQEAAHKSNTEKEMNVTLQVRLKTVEERLFVDYNGSREEAFNMAHDFSHLPDAQKTTTEFNVKAKAQVKDEPDKD